MPATTLETAKVRHEEFCTPRPGEEKPRVEGYVHMSDDPHSGRSVGSHFITRCLECGATHRRDLRS